jgi:hypothetical protein
VGSQHDTGAGHLEHPHAALGERVEEALEREVRSEGVGKLDEGPAEGQFPLDRRHRGTAHFHSSRCCAD